MPILVDFSPVVIAAACVECTGRNAQPLTVDLIRHMTLNSLKKYRREFGKKYGELVLCIDSGDVWRKDVFPYYKANRDKTKDTSGLDWPALFTAMGVIEQEFRDFMPYPVIKVNRTEADDLIAIIAKHHFLEGRDPVLIISGDKDFRQLQLFENVKQWGNVKKQYIVESEPALYLRQLIINGDGGDGVPNILSDDDTKVNPNKRMSRMTEGRMGEFLSKDPSVYEEYIRRNYYRNKQMVDLIHEIPEIYCSEAIKAYTEYKPAHKSRVMTYFAKYRLKTHLEDIQAFIA